MAGGQARRLGGWLPLAVFAVLATFLAIGLTLKPQELPSALVGRPAPAFDLAALAPDAPRVTDADLRGDGPVLVNFFASWCAPCAVEHPVLADLTRRGVRIVGVAYKDAPADAARFLAARGNPFAAVALDDDGRTAIEFGVYGVPETFVLDAEGRIVHRQVGALTDAVVADTLVPMLARLGQGVE